MEIKIKLLVFKKTYRKNSYQSQNKQFSCYMAFEEIKGFRSFKQKLSLFEKF